MESQHPRESPSSFTVDGTVPRPFPEKEVAQSQLQNRLRVKARSILIARQPRHDQQHKPQVKNVSQSKFTIKGLLPHKKQQQIEAEVAVNRVNAPLNAEDRQVQTIDQNGNSTTGVVRETEDIEAQSHDSTRARSTSPSPPTGNRDNIPIPSRTLSQDGAIENEDAGHKGLLDPNPQEERPSARILTTSLPIHRKFPFQAQFFRPGETLYKLWKEHFHPNRKPLDDIEKTVIAYSGVETLKTIDGVTLVQDKRPAIDELQTYLVRDQKVLESLLLDRCQSSLGEYESSFVFNLEMVRTSDGQDKATIVISCLKPERKAEIHKVLVNYREFLELRFPFEIIVDETLSLLWAAADRASADSETSQSGFDVVTDRDVGHSLLGGVGATHIRIYEHTDSGSDDAVTAARAEATLGGLITVAGELYGLTVAHPLVFSKALPSRKASTLNQRENDGAINGSESFTSATSRESRNIGKIVCYAISMSELNESSSKPEPIPPNSDWALIRFNDPPLPAKGSQWLCNELAGSKLVDDVISKDLLRITKDTDPKDIPVSVIAGVSGVVKGHLNLLPSNLNYGQFRCKVLRISLVRPLVRGDSGSWVTLPDGKLCGCVIAGRASISVAYTIPISDVFDSISQSFSGAPVGLPSIVTSPIKQSDPEEPVEHPSERPSGRALQGGNQLHSSSKGSIHVESPSSIGRHDSQEFELKLISPDTSNLQEQPGHKEVATKSLRPTPGSGTASPPTIGPIPRAGGLLLDTRLRPSDIAIGNLVLDVNKPTAEFLAINESYTRDNILESSSTQFSVSYSRQGSYNITKTLFPFSFSRDRSAQHLTAGVRRKYELRQQSEIFEIALDSHFARTPYRLERLFRKKGTVYFVVAYLTLTDAKSYSTEYSTISGTLNIAPLTAVAGFPAPTVVGPSLDTAASQTFSTKEEGEHVYAIGYRRVRLNGRRRRWLLMLGCSLPSRLFSSEVISSSEFSLAAETEWKIFINGFQGPKGKLLKESIL